MVNLFSVSALFIMYRETLEAAVVISVMISIMERLGLRKLKRQVWAGAIAGVSVAILLGVVFVITFYVVGNSVFKGKGQNIFKGFTSLLASALILWLSFAMLQFMGYEAKWERKLRNAAAEAADKAAKRRQKFSVFILAFSTTIREGIESVLFLTSVSGSTGAASIPIPGIVGIILGVITGLVIYFSGRLIKDIKWFFYFSTVFLLFVGAGLARTGIHYFQLAGWMGTWYPFWTRPWQNRPMFTMYSCCANQGTGFWPLMGAMFGYQDDPTPLEWIFYFGFWVLAAIIFIVKLKRGTLLTSTPKSERGEPLLCAHCGKAARDIETGSDSGDEHKGAAITPVKGVRTGSEDSGCVACSSSDTSKEEIEEADPKVAAAEQLELPMSTNPLATDAPSAPAPSLMARVKQMVSRK